MKQGLSPSLRAMWQQLYLSIATLSWSVLALCYAAHAAVTYFGFRAAGETDLTANLADFVYYYVTTATTVGYGDMSPATHDGRLLAALVVLPGSIALFTAFLGKSITAMGGYWRRRLQGQGDFSQRQGHTIVVGWQGARSRTLVERLVQGHREDRIVLLAAGLAENPAPDLADFVAATSMSEIESFLRAGAAGAARVVIRGVDDDETLTATLAAVAAATDAHIVIHLQDDNAAGLIERQFPQVEVVTSLASGLLARAARDPGASRLAALMFSDQTIDTAFSLKVPALGAPLPYFEALCSLKRDYGVTLIGVGRAGDTAGDEVDLNCQADCTITGGTTLYYIADNRIDAAAVDWHRMAGTRAEAA
ncbi:potassium channel family protein [Tsuneonella amylolytica]|uniref:potassium channel family protein n=1 Tax=Tsuneonella amylolytica TaxID=2338327 RepID=UPI000EA9D06F|nr:potassium channel family protein [Tsuneonella amylolytica]